MFSNPTAIARIKAQEEFNCEDCGHCCTECSPIEITREDLVRIAEYKNKSIKVAVKRYFKQNPSNKKTLAVRGDRPCRFYDLNKKRCKIYEVRPKVCRSYPFLSHEPMDSKQFVVPEKCKGAIKVYKDMKERGEIK